MYTIYDYLKIYKNISIKEYEWNMMDNLLCAIMAYIPLNSFSKMNYQDLVYEVLNKPNGEVTLVTPLLLKIIDIIKDSKRYEELKFCNFINYKDKYTQFGALTIKINNIKIISFKGTDGTVIGWLENFRLAYMYPTNTQRMAIEYLNNNISLFDNNIYVMGHSKGGNLAMVSAMELNRLKYLKIKKVINFDGPGFRKNEYESNKYKKLLAKLINYIPEGSYIGTLLYNDNYHVVKSTKHAVNEHFPTYWSIYGTMFIDGKLSKLSKGLNKRTTEELSKLDSDKIKQIFEKSFEVFNAKETTKIKLSLKDIMNLIKTVYNMDKELSSYILTIMKTMIILSKNKN